MKQQHQQHYASMRGSGPHPMGITHQHANSMSGPTSAEHSTLELKLEQKLKEVEITADDFYIAKECVRELRQAAQQLGEGWCVRPFGSICNGFAKHGSDLDATCCWDGSSQQMALKDAWELFEGLLPIIQASPKFEIMEEIRNARVPILKLKFDGTLEVDLSFQNTEPLPNTQLLRAYVCLHPLVRALGMLVKLWAQSSGICGAPNGCLSAYAFTLMAIYFMQVEPHMRLPCLQTSLFRGGDEIPSAARVQWTCDLQWSSRAWLLHRFFCFYASEFRWGQEVVSVRLGRRTAASDPAFSQLRGRYDQRMHIEDPFLPARNLHCVLRPEQEPTLHAKLCEAAEALSHGILPGGLWSPSPEPERWSQQGPPGLHVSANGIALGDPRGRSHQAAMAGDEHRAESKGAAATGENGNRRPVGSGQRAISEWTSKDPNPKTSAGSINSKAHANLSIHELSQASPPDADLPTTLLEKRWYF